MVTKLSDNAHIGTYPPILHRYLSGIILLGIVLLGYGGYLFLQRPTVSVVMPVYNREKIVGESIESILKQTFQDFEFIIVDDGSTDNTLAVVKKYAEQDSRIKIIVHEKNCGVGCARNTAQRAARGQYLSIMDSDDIAVPTKLETQVQIMTDYPTIVATNGKEASFSTEIPMKQNVREYHFSELEKFSVELFFYNWFGNSGAMIRRSFVVKNNIWYDETLAVGEDYDYWLQIVFAGGRLMKTKEYMMRIRKTPGSAMSSPRVVPDTLLVKGRALERILGKNDIQSVYQETKSEQCDILSKIVAVPTMPDRLDKRVILEYYHKNCADMSQ